MSVVIKYYKINEIFILSAVFILVVKTTNGEQCSFESLTECTKQLSVLTDSGLTFFHSKSDLNKICPNLKDSVKCIHRFTRKCMAKEHRLHFRKVFYGTGLMIHDLCRPGKYQNEYLKYAPCMINASLDNQFCFESYSTTMEQLKSNSVDSERFEDFNGMFRRKRDLSNDWIKNICCAFQQYAECSTEAVNKKCGSDTANFSIRFLTKMSSSMLNVHCNEYGKIGCKNEFVESRSSYGIYKISFTILLKIILFTIFFI